MFTLDVIGKKYLSQNPNIQEILMMFINIPRVDISRIRICK